MSPRQPTNDLPTERVKLIDEPDFRLVEVTIGDGVEHVMEVRDGEDAMGVQRWRRFETDSQKLKTIFSYLVRIAYTLQEREHGNA